MRLIHDHKVNPANDKIELAVLDEPGSGGACHEYSAKLPDGRETRISFQNGPINEVGVNGLTHEVLLAVVVDRMRDFQRGPYACRENALALTKLEEAQQWLQARTRGRMARGVEGAHAA
jgi:hypothetical protein